MDKIGSGGKRGGKRPMSPAKPPGKTVPPAAETTVASPRDNNRPAGEGWSLATPEDVEALTGRGPAEGTLCPHCACPDSQVVDTEPVAGGRRRRRECGACGARYSSVERVAR